MKLTIQNNIPDSPYKDITISFASLFVKQEYSALQNILAEDIYLVIYNLECKNGIDSVLNYLRSGRTALEICLNVKSGGRLSSHNLRYILHQNALSRLTYWGLKIPRLQEYC